MRLNLSEGKGDDDAVMLYILHLVTNAPLGLTYFGLTRATST